MKDYVKPIIIDEEIELEDVIAASQVADVDEIITDGDKYF